MDLVDQRWRWGAGCIVPQAGTFTPIPWLQLHGAAGALLRLFISILTRSILVALIDGRLAAGTCKQIVACSESGIGEAAGDSVEDARSNGRALHVKVVAMQQVVCGYVIQPAYGVHAAVVGEHAPNDKIRHHAPYLAQKLRDAQHLPRLIRLLDHGMLAICLQRGTRRRPHEVRPPNTCIPEIAQAHNDLLLHLLKYARIPARTSRFRPLLADEPDR